MERQLFSRRRSRLLALSRLMLALIFIAAVWLDPVQPTRSVAATYTLLIAYAAWCGFATVIAFRSWWYDFRLARLMHVIDIAIFTAATYMTESAFKEFSSPFIVFASFILIGASLRWGWRGVLWTALALVLLNFALGLLMHSLHLSIDPYRFSRRQGYTIGLAIMMLWLSTGGDRASAPRLPEPPGLPGLRHDAIMTTILDHARTVLGATGGAIALADGEEPWVEIMIASGSATRALRVGPGPLLTEIEISCRPTLFDGQRHRQLWLDTDGMVIHASERHVWHLATLCEVKEGLAASIGAARGPGQLLLWGIRGISPDDLPLLAQMTRDAEQALDREDVAMLARAREVSNLRNALARDLHDSVAQFLAGTLFRLEALRRWIREGNDPDTEIVAIKEALRREQAQMRRMIERLRLGEKGDRRTDLTEELGTLLEELGHHWAIETRLDAPPGPLLVPMDLAHEIRQITREAVANAVRHGRCRLIGVNLIQDDGTLKMIVSDDGSGFPADKAHATPRSISERVEALGGMLAIDNSARGVTLRIALPERTGA